MKNLKIISTLVSLALASTGLLVTANPLAAGQQTTAPTVSNDQKKRFVSSVRKSAPVLLAEAKDSDLLALGAAICLVYIERGYSKSTVDFLVTGMRREGAPKKFSVRLASSSRKYLCPVTTSPSAPQPPSNQSQSAPVPSVVGLPAQTASAVLQAAGFRMSPGAPMGSRAYIKSQAPPAGTRMALGSTVSVFFGY